MRLTVVRKAIPESWYIEQFEKAAAACGVKIDFRDIASPDTEISNFGEVVLWRSSSLGRGAERTEMMRAIRTSGRTLINRTISVFPHAAEKAFQQDYLAENTALIRGIKTFRFDSKQALLSEIRAGKLRYPLIQKPNCGSKGEGVEVIKNESEIAKTDEEVRACVYQNFIHNTGDYRALVLGGRMLGAIKRKASGKSLINNISRGGIGENVIDKEILEELRHISTTVASVFKLTLCGVDIIYDEIEKTYVFLEVNTVPQWEGFQRATGINVAEEIVSFCKRLAERKYKGLYETISEEYRLQEQYLGQKRFHFFSRMYLWTKDSASRAALDELRQEYIGTSTADYQEQLKELFTGTAPHGKKMIAATARRRYFDKYPQLAPFLALLFKYLFAEKIYNIDLRSQIREFVSDHEFLSVKHSLEKDADAIRVLSTHAINYFYLLEHYLGKEEASVDPKHYLDIARKYKNMTSPELQIYLLTHCIIGASRFYSEPIKEPVSIYKEMISDLESIIERAYDSISMDNKFEFLVCARICAVNTKLENRIVSEAENSLSDDGNFIIDKENSKATPDGRNDFAGSEHRNVLFLMSQSPFHPHDTKKSHE